ncbi:MAG: YgiQ family radical SAM protein [Oscillospiraceae bacterium]|nr:YgiQ family radical SAM protein [Oscillospiraceae bacterium]
MSGFLPISRAEMAARGWEEYDFLCITGDAYVDHPSFGFAIITRTLEAAGYRVGILAQPNFREVSAFQALGKPKYGIFITAGNIDSMVAHYTVSGHRRKRDDYTPGGVMGRRPDRAATVYARMAKRAYPDLPVVIGGLEASLRRFAHYDYWDNTVHPSVLEESGADLLSFGMGENTMTAIADHLASGNPITTMRHIPGIAYLTEDLGECSFPYTVCPGFDEVTSSKRAYAKACRIQMREQDPVKGKAVVQRHKSGFLVQTPPPMPLSEEEFDRTYELPYQKMYHPSYEAQGGVKAIEEVRFSIIHNRGCFGGCNFCSLAFHQGRMVTARSHESVIREAEELTSFPDFKGYLHDVGGPTANFRRTSCKGQRERGMCERNCLAPTPCKNLDADQTDYLDLLKKLRELPKIKRVFIRSGIRFDYLLQDKTSEFFDELVEHHVSGQLKVAPEHCSDTVLGYMGKPPFDVYLRFAEQFMKKTRRAGKEQYLVPYLISSHPGCTMQDAVKLAEYLNQIGHMPEQVQDFYPTPGTISTCMYYTGIDPRTMEEVYVPTDPHEKAMQRALLQWRKPEKRALVLEALKRAGREDLIGFGKECLIRPENRPKPKKPVKKGEWKPKGKAGGHGRSRH